MKVMADKRYIQIINFIYIVASILIAAAFLTDREEQIKKMHFNLQTVQSLFATNTVKTNSFICSYLRKDFSSKVPLKNQTHTLASLGQTLAGDVTDFRAVLSEKKQANGLSYLHTVTMKKCYPHAISSPAVLYAYGMGIS